MEISSSIPRIAQNLSKYRDLCGYTQLELADEADVDISTIRRIEQETCSSVQTATLDKLATALSIDTLFFFTDFTESEMHVLENFVALLKNPALLSALKKFI